MKDLWMKINWISNNNNGKGLELDYKLCKEFLESMGHSVQPIDFFNPVHTSANINIFSETIVPSMFPYANKNWFKIGRASCRERVYVLV